MSFTRFACFDWSGAAGPRSRGIALAVADGDGPVRPVARRWSRGEALDWLRAAALDGAPMLVGMDFSFALPFADAGAYLPGWAESPADAAALWALADADDDPALGCARLLARAEVARHFRHRGVTGDRFGARGGGRLRVVETLSPGAASGFNLVGPGQVGKASLTGMRLLHRLRGTLPVWPFDPLPAAGPVLVEVWTTLAARAAGLVGRSKMRDVDALRTTLARLGAAADLPAAVDDHLADAVLTAAWLRRVAGEAELWRPPALTPALARTEGWTFGVA